MKVSLSWLKELVPGLSLESETDIAALCEILNDRGLVVEELRRPSALEHVVVGEVKECLPIEGAKSVQLVHVDDGDGTREVVCGAFNFGPGDKVPLAKPGAKLPNGMEIAVREIKSLGVTSHGMLCAADELGLGEDHSGIVILAPESKIGSSVAQILGLDEAVVELEITPNRPDCMGMIGVAREVAAAKSASVQLPDFDISESTPAVQDLATVTIADADGCPRYVAMVVEDLTIGPSPAWLARRLRASGMRPINNIVDITNYIMLLWGQPLHAFDLDNLAGPSINVRRGLPDEKMTTLDDVERELSEQDLLICDATQPVAIAGVIGGQSSEVSPTTTRVLIESAHFDPESVMATAKRLGIRTESSARFERGVDPGNCDTAARHAAQLMAELGDGNVRAGIIDVKAKTISQPQTVGLRAERVNRLLGIDLTTSQVVGLLAPIGIGQVSKSESEIVDSNTPVALQFQIPSWRQYDLTREIDLIEEVGRCFGYNNIVRTLPASGERVGGLTPEQLTERKVRSALLASGLDEAQTTSFVSDALYDKLGWVDMPRVRLVNPIRDEECYLRTSLVPTLLDAAAYNVARNASTVCLAEIGSVVSPSPEAKANGDGLPNEKRVIGAVMCGVDAATPVHGDDQARPFDIYDIKGALEGIAKDLAITLDFATAQVPVPGIHPARTGDVVLAGIKIGWFGQLHPDQAKAFDLPISTVVAEIELDPLIRAHLSLDDSYRKISPHQATFFDVALEVDEGVEAGSLRSLLQGHAGPLCQSLELFDVFKGDPLPKGKKSLAFQFKFQAPDRTLTDEDVRPVIDNMVQVATQDFGARLRSG